MSSSFRLAAHTHNNLLACAALRRARAPRFLVTEAVPDPHLPGSMKHRICGHKKEGSCGAHTSY